MDSIDYPFLEKVAEFLKADDTDRALLLAGALGLPYEQGTEKRIHVIGAALRGKQAEGVVPQADWKDVVRQCNGWRQSHGIKTALLEDDPACGKNLLIQWASTNGHVELVRCLLSDSRVNPGDENQLALRMAVEHDQGEVVRLLLQDSRVDLDAAIAEAEKFRGWPATVDRLKKLKE